MAVTEHDVRHVAALARLGLDEARVPALVAELNGILVHMDALRKVKSDGAAVSGVGAGGMPLRADSGPQYPLARARRALAPAMRDGFYLVPRLATHADVRAGAGSPNAADEAASVDDGDPDAAELAE